MGFYPISTGNLLVVSKQSGATTDQTNLTINDTVYFRVNPANFGCATSTGYVLIANLDGATSAFDATINGNSYYPREFTISNPSAGSHSVSFSIQSPGGSSVATTSKSYSVASPPTILQQPVGLVVSVGNSATFTVGAGSGFPSPSYQWIFNDKSIGNATNSAYTITNAQTTNAGSYKCLLYNSQGSVVSSNAILQVTIPIVRPTIKSFTLTNMSAQIIFTGQAGSTNIIESTSDLAHWLSVATNINASGTSSVTMPVAATNSSGFYRIRLQN